jgi:hypothetical protein
MLLRLPLLLAAIIPASAAEWSWTWKPAPGDKTASASITTCKYGKSWAYAVEIDDGPKWVRSFAVPFLARHHFTDAPPGVAGGKALPFVGSVAAVVGAVGFNDSNVDWDDLKALSEAGWGVMNHSFDHRGLHWQESGKLNDREVADDAYWSQTILAAGLPGGRAPTGAVYANGYVDYNRNDVLAKAGIGIATRVGGSRAPASRPRAAQCSAASLSRCRWRILSRSSSNQATRLGQLRTSASCAISICVSLATSPSVTRTRRALIAIDS